MGEGPQLRTLRDPTLIPFGAWYPSSQVQALSFLIFGLGEEGSHPPDWHAWLVRELQTGPGWDFQPRFPHLDSCQGLLLSAELGLPAYSKAHTFLRPSGWKSRSA